MGIVFTGEIRPFFLCVGVFAQVDLERQDLGVRLTAFALDAEGKVVRIKRFTDKKEVNIEYTQNTKNISVKNKS